MAGSRPRRRSKQSRAPRIAPIKLRVGARTASPRRRHAAASPALPIPDSLLAEHGIEIVAEQSVSIVQARRSAATVDVIAAQLHVTDESAYVIAVRHPSGALTFHVPLERRSVAAGHELRFEVRSRSLADSSTARRGPISRVVKFVTMKLITPLVDRALPKLAAAWERRAWQQRRLDEGWHRVTRESLLAGRLERVQPKAALGASRQRSLLLIHGTFSNAVGCFAALTRTSGDFFDSMQARYGERIFAFNHFTVSKTPQENARDLLAALPAGPHTFDVITHSRGGLVLRSLVEQSEAFGALRSRFELGRAVLVAAPNEGTPLATGARWQQTLGWLANLLEILPDNPFTFGAELIAEGLAWLAARATGRMPGIAAMDATGELIGELRLSDGAPANRYAALVSNYEADSGVLQRMLDVGVDAFFATANDLVVPTEGGWRVPMGSAATLPAAAIGCFGPGGNIVDTTPVFHNNFFERPAAIAFLTRALQGQPTGLPNIDPLRAIDTRRRQSSAPAARPRRERLDVGGALAPASINTAAQRCPAPADDALHIVVLPPPEPHKPASILATYGSARVYEPLHTTGKEGGTRFRDIIATHERIKSYVDGKVSVTLPSEAALARWGATMFETLFPGKVRRLYDDARSRQRDGRLQVVFTSMIPWIADKPWEFAYDPSRRTYLATEDIHLVRNVLTAVPAESIPPHTGALRILVACAQPIGLGRLSVEEEAAVIQRSFQSLIETGKVSVQILPSATPQELHAFVASGRFDVVHLVCHGEFDRETQIGYLLFEDRNGGVHRIGDREAREILCNRGVRLVFLNACDTGRGGFADFNSGVAPALVAGGLPAVVANQYKVLDSAATSFAQHFYWSLAQGFTLAEAAREARIAVNYALVGESIDWAIPVLYARDATERLCTNSVAIEPVAPLRTRSGRRATQQHAQRIAVWDMNNQLPHLQQVLTRMNQAQNRFGFELIELSLPTGTVRLHALEKRQQPFVHADATAHRLGAYPGQLGVEQLACITGLPMLHSSDQQQVPLNTHRWWQASGQISMFSLAGLDLPTASAATDRAVSNGLVTLLAGSCGSLETHARAPKTCPLFTNPQRNLNLITGRQRFDRICRTKLRRADPQDLAAFDALLRAFD